MTIKTDVIPPGCSLIGTVEEIRHFLNDSKPETLATLFPGEIIVMRKSVATGLVMERVDGRIVTRPMTEEELRQVPR